VSIIIRRYTDHMKFVAYMAVSFIAFFILFLFFGASLSVYMVVRFVCFFLIL